MASSIDKTALATYLASVVAPSGGKVPTRSQIEKRLAAEHPDIVVDGMFLDLDADPPAWSFNMRVKCESDGVVISPNDLPKPANVAA